MTLKLVAWIGLGVLSLAGGSLALGNRRSTTDPANAVAAYFMVGAHCPGMLQPVSPPEPRRPGFPGNRGGTCDVAWTAICVACSEPRP